MPEKIYKWSGDKETFTICAAQACRNAEFEIISSKYNNLLFKNRGYDGEINVESEQVRIKIGPNGGLSASTICLCFLVFLFGLQLINAWWVFSRKPKNFIKKIVENLAFSLEQYPGTIINVEPL